MLYVKRDTLVKTFCDEEQGVPIFEPLTFPGCFAMQP